MTSDLFTHVDPKIEMADLAAEIAKHQQAYHVDDAPTISDNEYDAKIARLRQLERDNPTLVAKASPAAAVGAAPNPAFAQVSHAQPMLSLDNMFDMASLEEWLRTRKRFLGLPQTYDYPITVEIKLDGLSLSARYENRRLATAATRGDGATGEDVTANAAHVAGLPQTLPDDAPDIVEIRGEVVMPKADFLRLNATGEAGRTFATARNAAAGSLRQKNPAKTRGRGLVFFAHGIGETSEPLGDSWPLIMERLSTWGFTGDGTRTLWETSGRANEIQAIHEQILEIRDTLPFDIDGAVDKFADMKLRTRLGEVSRTPRWGIAYKFPAEKVETTIEAIDLQIGRTGRATPVARLKPVTCGGVSVANATLHNAAHVAGLDLRVGDQVILQRAGDVIPQVVGRAANNEGHDERSAWTMPDRCPVCDHALLQEEGEVDHRCQGGFACNAQAVTRLAHIAGRDALDIDGLGEETVAEMHAAGLLRRPADIFRLHQHRADLIVREGWGTASVDKLLAGIETARATTVDRALVSLGIHHVGRSATKAIAREWGSIDEVMVRLAELADIRTAMHETPGSRTTWQAQDDKAMKKVAETVGIPDVGPVVLRNLLDFMSDEDNASMARELFGELSLSVLAKPKTVASPIAGKTVVFTGTLESVSREEAKAQAERLGAKASGSISAKTDILVAGPGAGSKLKAAEKIVGIKIIDENAWLKLVREAEGG